MTTILFRPFDLGKWFALGFSAWLAMLGQNGSSGSGGGGSSESGNSEGNDSTSDATLAEFLQPLLDFYQEHQTLILYGGVALVILFLVIAVLFIWLSSRGKFMFLDNVVHNRALVKAPWAQFRSRGHSLFVWRLVFHLIAFVVAGGLVVSALAYFAGAIGVDFGAETVESALPEAVAWDPAWLIPLLGFGAAALLLITVFPYIGFLLESFVIPLMYQHDLSATEAWRRFLKLHNARFGHFLLFALWNLLLWIPILFLVLAFVLLTCCLGGILLAIPYLGAVTMLPITVFIRSLSLEFFRQFGEDYDVWEGLEDDGFFPEPPALPAHR